MAAVPYIQKAGFLTKNAKNPVLWKNAAEDAILGKKRSEVRRWKRN